VSGEFGVRGWSAYNIKDGKLARRGYSMVPSDTLIDPERRPPSASRLAGTPAPYLAGRQWKIGGGTTWGWYSWRSRPPSNVLRLGQLDLNPKQRPGDNKWSMVTGA
jgi:hypothetical protein